MKRLIAGYEFAKVGRIQLDRDNEMPQSRYVKANQTPLHKYGHGPFCRFSVAKGCRKSGVYVLSDGDNGLYVGECQNLETRWGPRGYGTISPANCFEGGTQTDCRINNLILQASKGGAEMTLWFHEVEGIKRERLAIERKQVEVLKPPWNR
jgi:hypothetical protein